MQKSAVREGGRLPVERTLVRADWSLAGQPVIGRSQAGP